MQAKHSDREKEGGVRRAQKTGTFSGPAPVHLAVLAVAVATGHNECSWQQTLKVFFLFIFFSSFPSSVHS